MTMINKAIFAVFILSTTSSWTATSVESKVTSHRHLEDLPYLTSVNMCVEASEAILNKASPSPFEEFYDLTRPDLEFDFLLQCQDAAINGTNLSCVYDHAVQDKQRFDTFTDDCTKKGGSVYVWNDQNTCFYPKTSNIVTVGTVNKPACLVLSESACSSNVNKFQGEAEAYSQFVVDTKESMGLTCLEPLAGFVKYSGCTILDYRLGTLIAVSCFFLLSWYV